MLFSVPPRRLYPPRVRHSAVRLSLIMENARIIGEVLKEKGIEFTGGENSPYLWLKCPNGMKSWDFFDFLI